MNIDSKTLGKGIAITITVLAVINIVFRIVYVLGEGAPMLFIGLLVGLGLSAVLYVNFWRGKEWARLILGVIMILRGVFGAGAGILASMSEGMELPVVQILLHLAGIALGVALLAIPGVRRYLRSLNA